MKAWRLGRIPSRSELIEALKQQYPYADARMVEVLADRFLAARKDSPHIDVAIKTIMDARPN